MIGLEFTHQLTETNKKRENTMIRYKTELWAELVNLQNLIPNVDILTITVFMDDDALKANVARYQDAAINQYKKINLNK